MRVYEIAKEVGIPNKDLITKIRALGLEVWPRTSMRRSLA